MELQQEKITQSQGKIPPTSKELHCNYCPRKFTEQKDLVQHVSIVHHNNFVKKFDTKEFPDVIHCNYCGERFTEQNISLDMSQLLIMIYRNLTWKGKLKEESLLNVISAITVLCTNRTWKNTLNQFMKKQSLLNVISVTTDVLTNITWKYTLDQCMKKQSLSNVISVITDVPTNLTWKDTLIQFMKKQSLLNAIYVITDVHKSLT